MNVNTALVRIITRYLSGALTTIGLSGAIVNAPEVQNLIVAGVGIVLGAGTEWLYSLAKRQGGDL